MLIPTHAPPRTFKYVRLSSSIFDEGDSIRSNGNGPSFRPLSIGVGCDRTIGHGTSEINSPADSCRELGDILLIRHTIKVPLKVVRPQIRVYIVCSRYLTGMKRESSMSGRCLVGHQSFLLCASNDSDLLPLCCNVKRPILNSTYLVT